MNRLLALLLILPGVAHAQQRVYVACATDRRVEAYTVDPADGTLSAGPRLALAGAPGPMALSPDGARLYVGTFRRERRARIAEVVTLRRLPQGALKVEGTARIDDRPTYLRATRNHLLTASYGAGRSAVYPILRGVARGERTDRETTERTAHCIELDPSGAFAYVPHTAPNRVYQYRFDARRGQLTPNAPPFVAGPPAGQRRHQPRHIRFHPTLPVAYTSNERGGGISAWRLDRKRGTLTRFQTLSALPPEFEGESAAAEVRITPDGRYAYVSNRDKAKTPTGRDTLAGFAIDPKTGSLRAIGHIATARFPRSFTIGLRGRFVYAAGQRDHRVAVYRLDPTSGFLKEVERKPVGKRPSWVLCAAPVAKTP